MGATPRQPLTAAVDAELLNADNPRSSMKEWSASDGPFALVRDPVAVDFIVGACCRKDCHDGGAKHGL
jgi:hypothetical protein